MASTFLKIDFPELDTAPQRRSEATTSAEVIGFPLWNFTSLRRRIT
jgi:hypothetical protein